MGPLSRCRLYPDLATVPLNRLAADGQADSRSLVLVPGMKPLKRLEDLLCILRRNADPVVFNAKNPMLTLLFGGCPYSSAVRSCYTSRHFQGDCV